VPGLRKAEGAFPARVWSGGGAGASSTGGDEWKEREGERSMEMDDERSRVATEYAVSGAGNERAVIGALLRLLAGRSRSVFTGV